MIDSLGASSAATTAKGSSAAAVAGTGQMGKEDFLKLLVTQLKHQDPLNPQESTEFVTQLAQFTTLERLVNIDESMMSVAGASMVTNATLAAGFIDSTVRAQGDTFQFDGKPEKLHYELSAEAAEVTIEVRDEQGNLVRTFAGTTDAGANTVVWDGKKDDGSIAPAGKYSFAVVAKDADGKDIGASTSIEAHVEAVQFKGGVPHLLLDTGASVPLSATLEILAKGDGAESAGSGADGQAGQEPKAAKAPEGAAAPPGVPVLPDTPAGLPLPGDGIPGIPN